MLPLLRRPMSYAFMSEGRMGSSHPDHAAMPQPEMLQLLTALVCGRSGSLALLHLRAWYISWQGQIPFFFLKSRRLLMQHDTMYKTQIQVA